MKLNIRKIVFLTLILGVLGGTYVFVLVPAYLERKDLRADIRLKKRAMADLANATRVAQELNNQAASVRLAIDRFTSHLPREEEATCIVGSFSQTAVRHKLSVETIEPGRIVDLAEFSRKPLHLLVSGDCSSLYGFLQDIERLPEPVRITQMALRRGSQDGEVSADLTIEVYFASVKPAPPIQSVSTQ